MLYRIKSLKWTKHKATNPSGETVWWGPNNSGYTSDITQAGIYTEEQIKKHKQYHEVGIVTEIVPIETGRWSVEQISDVVQELETDIQALQVSKEKYQEAKKLMEETNLEIECFQRIISQKKMDLDIQKKYQA